MQELSSDILAMGPPLLLAQGVLKQSAHAAEAPAFQSETPGQEGRNTFSDKNLQDS